MNVLTSAERDFFALVRRAAYSNPFGAERAAIDRQLAAIRGDEVDVLQRVLARLRARLMAVDQRVEITQLSAPDLELVQHGTLFEVFHHFSEAFDALIDAELAAGTRQPVPWSKQLLSRLTARGFSQGHAHRMLGFLWQMQRAFTFIGGGLVGRSPVMGGLREALWNNVFTQDVGRYEVLLWDRMEDFSTVLLGETGTGKGAAAAAIGRSGYIPWDASRGAFAESFTQSFVPINLSEYPESLIESELFGHAKGAFTGAIDDYAGIFQRCSPHGAILLDEIAEVRTPVQVKLLRVLQERAFTPVGSRTPQRFEGRVIAATHQPLDALRAEGRFRDDLWYRLCADVIVVPPLRTRIAEDPHELNDLLAVLLARILGTPNPTVAEEVHAAIVRDLGLDYPWPGNVRELEQVCRRVLLTRRCKPEASPTPTPAASDRADALADALRGGQLDARAVLDHYCALLYAQHGTYERVARVTGLDRRTVKKHVLAAPG
jgi:transcriptional regulator of acetoin/glycerol metabolism